MEQTPWIELGPGIWQSTYGNMFAGGANCIAFDIGGGNLAVLSPSQGTPAARFDEIDKRGNVTVIMATGGHDLGQEEWQNRYANAACYAPEMTIPTLVRKKPHLRQAHPVSKVRPTRSDVKLVDLPGTKVGSPLVRVGNVVYVDELIGNPHEMPPSKMFSLVFKLTDSAPGLKRNWVFKAMMCSNARLLATKILDNIDGATTIAFAHGDAISGERVDEARAILQKLAG